MISIADHASFTRHTFQLQNWKRFKYWSYRVIKNGDTSHTNDHNWITVWFKKRIKNFPCDQEARCRTSDASITTPSLTKSHKYSLHNQLTTYFTPLQAPQSTPLVMKPAFRPDWLLINYGSTVVVTVSRPSWWLLCSHCCIYLSRRTNGRGGWKHHQLKETNSSMLWPKSSGSCISQITTV